MCLYEVIRAQTFLTDNIVPQTQYRYCRYCSPLQARKKEHLGYCKLRTGHLC